MSGARFRHPESELEVEEASESIGEIRFLVGWLHLQRDKNSKEVLRASGEAVCVGAGLSGGGEGCQKKKKCGP